MPFELSLKPLLALVVLAVRAIAMTTGMRHDALLATRAAIRQHARGQVGAAALHGIKGSSVAGQDRGLILPQVIGLKALDDGAEGNHLTAPQCSVKLLIKLLMRVLACSLVWLVRWV